MFVFFHLVCSRIVNFSSIGYDVILINETVQIDLDFRKDYLFLLDSKNDSFRFEIKTLDMQEFAEINPGSRGFAGFFLTSVAISKKTDENSFLQMFSLPPNYCNHHFISYISDFDSKETLLWSNNSRDFKVCLVNEKLNAENILDISFSSDNLRCTYSKPNNYGNNDFNGTQITKNARIRTENGLILQIYMGISEHSSSFNLVSESKNRINQKIYSPIPYYFTTTPDGNDFLDVFDIRFRSQKKTKFILERNQKIGLSISLFIMIISVILFIYNICSTSKDINL